jgi:hypothetical protein
LKIPKRYSKAGLWELSKGLNIFMRKAHFTVHKLSYCNETVPGQNQIFFLSEITEPRCLELPIAQTYFDSPLEFEPAKFYCITKHFKKCRFAAIQKDPTQLKK